MMRVTTTNVDDFLENLRSEPNGSVLQNIVYVSISRNPIDGDKRTAARFAVTVQASAVVNLPGDEGQYILEYGETVGVDYEDSTKRHTGSDAAAEIKRKIIEHCDDVGLRVRPGIVEP